MNEKESPKSTKNPRYSVFLSSNLHGDNYMIAQRGRKRDTTDMPPPTSPDARQRSSRTSVVFLLSTLILCFLYYAYSSSPSIHPDAVPIGSLKSAAKTCGVTPKSKRVAIIGAGSAGASTAYYLARAQAVGQIDPCVNLTITVFERNGYIGGRSTTVQPYISRSSHSKYGYPRMIVEEELSQAPRQSQPSIELGGSIFVTVNTNLVNAAASLGLTLQSASHARPKVTGYGLGIWDGVLWRFMTHDGDSWWRELGRLWNRYGLAPLRAQRAMKGTVGRFRQMYDAPHFPWSNLTKVVQEVNLDGVTGVSGRAYTEGAGISDVFSQEIIQASTRVNYAQNLDQIHGLETMVCLATDGAVSVKGGNWQIFQGMVKSSGAELRLNTEVRALYSLDKDKTGRRFGIKSTSSLADYASQVLDTIEEFDDVVVATPLQFSHLDIGRLSPEHVLPEPIQYVDLHVTLLATNHKLSQLYFQHDKIPETVLTTLPTGLNSSVLPFFSVSALRNLTNPHTGEREYAYKIFSPQPVDELFLKQLFGLGESGKISWIYEHMWHAYPYLPPKTTFDGPDLGNGLWYTSGIESFVSTMETSSLAGNNVAALLVQSWSKDVQEEPDVKAKAGL